MALAACRVVGTIDAELTRCIIAAHRPEGNEVRSLSGAERVLDRPRDAPTSGHPVPVGSSPFTDRLGLFPARAGRGRSCRPPSPTPIRSGLHFAGCIDEPGKATPEPSVVCGTQINLVTDLVERETHCVDVAFRTIEVIGHIRARHLGHVVEGTVQLSAERMTHRPYGTGAHGSVHHLQQPIRGQVVAANNCSRSALRNHAVVIRREARSSAHHAFCSVPVS